MSFSDLFSENGKMVTHYQLDKVLKAAMVVTIVLLSIIDMFHSTIASGVTLTAVMLIFIFYDAMRTLHVHLLFFYPNFYFIGMLISGVSIYSGAYLIESELFGHPNGVVGMYSLLYLFCLYSFKVGFGVRFSAYLRTIERTFSPMVQRCLILIVAAFLFAAILSVIAIYSSPVLLGINRIQYFKSVPAYIYYLRPAIFYFVFLAAYTYFILHSARTGTLLLLTSAFFIYFFLGERFSGFVHALVAFFAVYAASRERLRITLPFVLGLCAVFVGLSVLVVYTFGWGTVGLDQFKSRIALQLQVGWIFFNEGLDWLGGPYSEIPLRDMAHHIGYLYTPYHFYVTHYIEGGYTLTGFYPAALTLKYGMLGMLGISFVMCFILGVISSFLKRQLRNRQLTIAFVLYSSYLQLVLFMFALYFPGAYGKLLLFSTMLVGVVCFSYTQRNVSVASAK